jgi:RNA recognition motif-containing protein
MPDDDEARKAIQHLNSQEIDGRHVKVNIAKPRKNFSNRNRS